jgi:hypothetical protein
MSEALIRRLQERIRAEPTVDFAVKPPIRPRPPVTERALAGAEARLGFPLSPLVRALYTQVADGGYGPGYGVIELDGDEYWLVGSRGQMDVESANSPGGRWWPERLVPFVNWGCHYFSGVDCSRPSCPVFFYDHDRAVGDMTFTDCLFPDADSLAGWLSDWLAGEDLWERGRQRGLHR